MIWSITPPSWMMTIWMMILSLITGIAIHVDMTLVLKEVDAHVVLQFLNPNGFNLIETNMQPHVKIYLDKCHYTTADFIPCELSGKRAIDVCHIHRRGIGGNNRGYERIENYMAKTRELHNLYGDKVAYKAYLYYKHMEFLEYRGVVYDKDWILNQIIKFGFDCPVCQTFNCLNLEHLATYSKLLTSNVK